MKLVLFAKAPPRIHPIATHRVTNEGVPASLPCAASEVPTPTVTWTKVGGASGLQGKLSQPGMEERMSLTSPVLPS